MGPKYTGKMKREGASGTLAAVSELRARTEEPLRLYFSPHCFSPRLQSRDSTTEPWGSNQDSTEVEGVRGKKQ